DPMSIHWTDPDTYFGSGTEIALKDFQSENNLPENGILDSFTANKIAEILENSYYIDQSSETIRQLKSDLLRLGFGDSTSVNWTNPDTYFGPGTQQALLDFQAHYNLNENGILDPTTANKITEILE